MAGVAEVGTYPSVNYIDSWWSVYPRDERLSKVEYVQFNSTASIDAKNDILFILPPTDAPNLYDLSDVLMKVQVRILTEKNLIPNKGKYNYYLLPNLKI